MVISRAASEVGQNLLGIGRKILGPQGSLHRKMVVGGALGGMGLKGIADVVIPGTIDAAMDVAFDDPNADEKILGTQLTPSLLVGGSLPGEANATAVAGGTIAGAGAGAYLGRKIGGATGMVLGGVAGAMTGGYGSALATGGAGAVARGMNPTRFGSAPAPGTAAQVGVIGSGVGAMAGGAYGFRRKGFKGALVGSIGGAAVGALPGAVGVGGSAAFAVQSARENSQIRNQSPFYNSSLMTADRLNASGDIVLGAHNTRRGR